MLVNLFENINKNENEKHTTYTTLITVISVIFVTIFDINNNSVLYNYLCIQYYGILLNIGR